MLLEGRSGDFAYLVSSKPNRAFQLNRHGIFCLKALHLGVTMKAVALLCSLVFEDDLEGCRRKVAGLVGPLTDLGILRQDPARRARSPFRKVRTSRPLLRVFLELTKNCNQRCLHCYAEAGASPPTEEDLSLAEIESLIAQAARLGVMEFDVTGGEPFTRPDMAAALRAFHRAGMLVNLYTNATLLDQANLAALIKYPVRSLIVSLDSLDQEVHDRLRGMAGAQARTIQALRRLRGIGQPFRVNISLNKLTHKRVLATARWALEDLGACSLAAAPLFSVGRGRKNRGLWLDRESCLEVLAELYRRWGPGPLAGEHGGGPPGSPACGVAESMLFISAGGEVSFCPTLTAGQAPELALGNVRRTSLGQLWELGMLRHRFYRAQCRDIGNCPAAGLCRGGCRSRAFLETGEMDAPDPLSCGLFRGLLAEQGGCRTEPLDAIAHRGADLPL